MKPVNQKAWFLVVPVLLLMTVSALAPLMTVVNHSVQDAVGGNAFVWAGSSGYEQVLKSERFWNALARNLAFSAIILAIELPLGVIIALAMPRKGPWVAACLAFMALPLLIPWNVVGVIWQVFGRSDIGLLGAALNGMGIDYDYMRDPIAAWATLIAMDVWHWTSLVALLAYAGLVAIPDACYQAARIDGASRVAVFRHIELPRMGRVLTIAVMLRFLDSFTIYAEPLALTGGGPGGSTTFVSTDLIEMAAGQVAFGPAAAMSMVYFLTVLAISWVFHAVIMRHDARATEKTSGKRGSAT